MKKKKKCHRTQKIKNKRGSSAGIFFTSSAGAVTSLILIGACSFLSFPEVYGVGEPSVDPIGISMTSSGAQSINVTPGGNNGIGTSISEDAISITTECPAGYNLGISTSVSNNNLYLNGNSSSSSYLSPSNGITALQSAANTWGYYYNSSTPTPTKASIFSPVPTSSTTIKTSSNTTDNFSIYYGVAVNNTLPTGTYKMIPDSNNSNADGTIVYYITAADSCFPYIVHFDPTSTTGGDTLSGTGTMNDQIIPVGLYTSLNPNTYTAPSGYEFDSWNTSQDGTGTSYADEAPIINLTTGSQTITLYAQWTPTPPLHVSCSTPVPGITYMQELSDSAKKASALSNMTQGAQYVLIDNRDDQGYCVSKEADGNIWMTQNLDFCIGCTGVQPLTSENTDLNTSGSGIYTDGYATSGGVATWTPDTTAITSGRTTSSGLTYNNNEPYSAEGGDRYYYTTGSTSNEAAQTLAQCVEAGHTESECAHYHVGNYYNWTATIASNDSSGILTQYDNASNSICPRGWKLPIGDASTSTSTTRQFGYLFQMTGIIDSLTATSYTADGFNNIRTSPLFFVRGGSLLNSGLFRGGYNGLYWSSTVSSNGIAYGAGFASSAINSTGSNGRGNGLSVRCMVR